LIVQKESSRSEVLPGILKMSEAETAKYNFVFFDLETTGLYNSNPDIVQVRQKILGLNP